MLDGIRDTLMRCIVCAASMATLDEGVVRLYCGRCIVLEVWKAAPIRGYFNIQAASKSLDGFYSTIITKTLIFLKTVSIGIKSSTYSALAGLNTKTLRTRYIAHQLRRNKTLNKLQFPGYPSSSRKAIYSLSPHSHSLSHFHLD